MRKPLRYTDELDPAWSAAAIETFQIIPLPDSDDPVALELEGLCPRCKDRMQHIEFLIAFKGVSSTNPMALRAAVKALKEAGVMNEPLLPAEFSIRCSCQVPHSDRLARSGLKGCGASWKMRIESVEEEAK